MNYIKHLNSVFQKFYEDSRLNPSHISLYLALFQFWNMHRFPKVFFIDREETMKLAKIGSKTTYHRALGNLDTWDYIDYLPSYNPFKGSQVKMAIFWTGTEEAMDKHETGMGTGDGQEMVSNTNPFKPIQTKNKLSLESRPENEDTVLLFFKKKEYPEKEALKFYNHYQGVGWKIGGKIPIEDWKATANNWMLKANQLEGGKQESIQLKETDFLKTSQEKNYDEPL